MMTTTTTTTTLPTTMTATTTTTTMTTTMIIRLSDMQSMAARSSSPRRPRRRDGVHRPAGGYSRAPTYRNSHGIPARAYTSSCSLRMHYVTVCVQCVLRGVLGGEGGGCANRRAVSRRSVMGIEESSAGCPARAHARAHAHVHTRARTHTHTHTRARREALFKFRAHESCSLMRAQPAVRPARAGRRRFQGRPIVRKPSGRLHKWSATEVRGCGSGRLRQAPIVADCRCCHPPLLPPGSGGGGGGGGGGGRGPLHRPYPSCPPPPPTICGGALPGCSGTAFAPAPTGQACRPSEAMAGSPFLDCGQVGPPVSNRRRIAGGLTAWKSVGAKECRFYPGGRWHASLAAGLHVIFTSKRIIYSP